jgi:hypothetical protein
MLMPQNDQEVELGDLGSIIEHKHNSIDSG